MSLNVKRTVHVYVVLSPIFTCSKKVVIQHWYPLFFYKVICDILIKCNFYSFFLLLFLFQFVQHNRNMENNCFDFSGKIPMKPESELHFKTSTLIIRWQSDLRKTYCLKVEDENWIDIKPLRPRFGRRKIETIENAIQRLNFNSILNWWFVCKLI